MTTHQHPDVSCYVALGDSITSGYADGALYYTGQQFSYANILANQFRAMGCRNFKQPLMSENSVGVDPLGNSRLVLKQEQDHLKDYLLGYFAAQGDLESFNTNIFFEQGPFNNLGVPGAKVTTLLAPGFGNPANGPGNYNPFFTRMASNPATASMLSDALQLHPTFFTLFIGNNDALAYALSGGLLNPITPPEGAPGSGFEASLKFIVDALTANGAKGAIATLPSIESIPYFVSIPYNGLLLDAEQASWLNRNELNNPVQFHDGKQPFRVNDPFLGLRELKEGEFVLLDVLLDQNKLQYLKGLQPLPKKYILSHKEIITVKDAIATYNKVIRKTCEKKNLALVDIALLMSESRPDRSYNPATFNLEYKRKGVFSLDGLHPNAFGQAIIANEFIKAINKTYDTDIPQVKTIQYPGLSFP